MPDNADFKKQDKLYHEDAEVVYSYDKRLTDKYRWEHKYLTIDKWAERLKNSGKKKILDCGCGTGAATLKILAAGMDAFSVDASSRMLEQTRRKAMANNLVATCISADVDDLPFEAEIFDGVICAGLLHHLPDPVNALTEQLRVLKKDGLLFITEPFASKAWFSYPYYCLVFLAKAAANLFKKQDITTFEAPLTKADITALRQILSERGAEYTVDYIVYWPHIFTCLPDFLAYFLISFLNKLNTGSSRGDSVVITARKMS